MKVLTKDLIKNSIIYNKDIFYAYTGHSVDFVKDSRAAKQGWFSSISTLDASTYGNPMYGEQLYGNMVVKANFVSIVFDLGAVKQFDVLGITGHNIVGGTITAKWGADSTTTAGSKLLNVGDHDRTMYFQLSTAMLSYRYFALEFTNVTEQGILKLGNIGLGQEFTVNNIAPTYDTNITSNARRQLTETRQLYGGPVVQYRSLSFTTAPVDSKDNMVALMAAVDTYKPAYWYFDESCLDEEPLYGMLEDVSIGQFNDEARLYSGRISMSEVY